MSKEPTEAHALPYATTSYEADQDGALHAVLPTRCVYATGEQTCAIFVDHYRERKTGPCYAVAVVGCRVHGRRRYRLYPPGHKGDTACICSRPQPFVDRRLLPPLDFIAPRLQVRTRVRSTVLLGAR